MSIRYVLWWLEYLFRNYKEESRWGSGFWRLVEDVAWELEWYAEDLLDKIMELAG